MSDHKIRRALIAVYDKTGIAEFARALADEFGIEIISTGGTAKHLKEAGIPVTMVEQVTGFPEMLDGRVKTLHPKIHAAILADRDNPGHMRQLAEQGIKPIDMVVVNLYPFEKTVADPNCTFEQAIEMIDIGGPCMLRAAAKNHKHVLVVTTQRRFSSVLEALRSADSQEQLRNMARWEAHSVFLTTSSYDQHIKRYLICEMMSRDQRFGPEGRRDLLPEDVDALRHPLDIPALGLSDALTYGENPHQQAQYAILLSSGSELGLPGYSWSSLDEPLRQGGKRPSFNNYVDADAALGLCSELSRAELSQNSTSLGAGKIHSAVFIKHTNACGVGISADPVEAYRQAYLGDPNAAMGGILAVDFPVDAVFAEIVMDTLQRFKADAENGGCQSPPQAFFIEVWVAPSFDKDAISIIRSRKKWGANVRLLAIGDMNVAPDSEVLQYKSIAGGMLVQSPDLLGLNEDQWKVVTKRSPTEQEMADLRLAWLIAKHTKSNAISICKDGMLIGNGAGQMSRVMSCRIATWLARENGHTDKLQGSVAASDAFFPFRDGPEILMEAGVTAIIQPGGSKRDEETIAACDERDMAMIFTGTRHFKH